MDFECGVHLDENSKPYKTPSVEEWNNHLATLPHEHQGFGSCKDCGQKNIPHKVTMTLQPLQVPPAYCDDCLVRLKEQIAAIEAQKK